MRKGKILALAAGIALFFAVPAIVCGADVLQAEVLEESAVSPEKEETDRGYSFNYVHSEGKILDRIYLGDINLSGLNREAAQQVSEERMKEITGYPIMLHMDDETVGVPAAALGVSGDNERMLDRAAQIGQAGNVIKRYKVKKDLQKEPIQIPMQYQVDESMLRAALEERCLPVNRKMTAYGLKHVDGSFQIINGRRGVALKMEESVQRVTDYLTNIWKDGVGDLDLDVEITEPKGSREQLARVKDMLGYGSTDYSSSSPERATNVKNGTAKLNGKVLYPGESISVCGTMMPFDEENGYMMAPSYANGAVVDSMGGGICQVSTTLYLAVLRAELSVAERHNHSMSVGYVKPAMDAAIAEGSKDFRFTNNLDAPIYIEGFAWDGKLSFAIYGEEYRPQGREVIFESETLETIEPTTELQADTRLPFGTVEKIQSPHTGYNSKLWKIIRENGEETRVEANTSYYMMAPGKYKVGVQTSNTAALNEMYSAIALNDLEKVQALAGQN